MEKTKKLPLIEISPHQKASYDTPWVMKQVIFALLPVCITSIVFFRLRAIALIATAIITALLTESLVMKLRNRKNTIADLSAVLTALLFALVIPSATPLWCVALGTIFAVVAGKQLFGGLGQNIFNPALVGRAFLMAAFPVIMTTWSSPFTLDAMSAATPLAAWKFSQSITSSLPLFLGNVGGCLGETSALAILFGGIYLLLRKIACWRAPLAMLLSTLFLSTIFYLKDPAYASPLFHVLSGGYLLALFFMVTDPVTSPMSKLGRYIFGACVGLIIMVIRYWAGLPEGTMYSILFMNAFVPIIDKVCRPKPFGRR